MYISKYQKYVTATSKLLWDLHPCGSALSCPPHAATVSPKNGGGDKCHGADITMSERGMEGGRKEGWKGEGKRQRVAKVEQRRRKRSGMKA